MVGEAVSQTVDIDMETLFPWDGPRGRHGGLAGPMGTLELEKRADEKLVKMTGCSHKY